MPTKKPRVTITMTEEEFRRIEEYRFRTRQKNQTQAILSLIESGIDSILDEQKTEKSPDPEGPRDEEVEQFTAMVSQLSDEHKRFLAVVIQALIELEQGQLDGSQAKADKTE